MGMQQPSSSRRVSPFDERVGAGAPLSGIRHVAVTIATALILAGLTTACRDTRDTTTGADASKERGAALFVEHCVDCHGSDARGEGPIARGLSSVPADLTLISQRRGGEFPDAEIRRMVDGRSDFVGHRDVEMPLWGEFFDDDPEHKITALVRYLEGLQREGAAAPGATASTTGRDLFMRYCASCHGAEATGDGPVASSLTTPPADLTTLAQRAGGRFDGSDVMSTIDGRRNIAAHGDREMPVWGVAFMSEHAAAGERQAEQISLLLTKLLTDYVASLQEE